MCKAGKKGAQNLVVVNLVKHFNKFNKNGDFDNSKSYTENVKKN